MNKYTVYAVIKLSVKSELEFEEMIDELEQNSLYTIPGTENVKITETAWLETTTQLP